MAKSSRWGVPRHHPIRRGASAVAALSLLAGLGVIGLGAVASPARATGATCAAATSGGDWPSYAHDLSGTRTQDQESTLSAANAWRLKAKWQFSTVSASPNGGTIETTPTVSGGCLFVGTSSGEVFALNADTGATVWSTQLVPPTTPAGFGGLIVGAPAVDEANHMVIVGLDTFASPKVVALDERTGAELWRTVVESAADGAWGNVAAENASPTIFNGLVFLGFYGSEFDERARGGYVVLNETHGTRLVHQYTISDADYALGYRGASIWATAAIDPATQTAYVGTGNPGGHPDPNQPTSRYPECFGTIPGQPCNAAIEAATADAILKIDVNPASPTMGHMIGWYKGNPDNYVTGAGNQPACANAGQVEVSSSPPAGAWSIPCAQLDLDFGASPNLFLSTGGQLVVGELQKSGVYHAALAGSMAKAWTATVGAPGPAFNAGSPAVGGGGIYGESAPGGTMFSLNRDSGLPQWATPAGDGAHYQSTSTANGVVYTVDTLGMFDAYSAATGVPLLRHPLALDTGGPVDDLGSSGVSVARHTVYVAESGFIIAYGL